MLGDPVLTLPEDKWIDLYDKLPITAETDWQFRVPSKTWLKRQVVEISQVQPLHEWVSIGAGYDSTALELIRRDHVTQYDLTLVDVAYANPRLARRAYLCLMNSLRPRLSETIVRKPIIGRSRFSESSALDAQILALGYDPDIVSYLRKQATEPIVNADYCVVELKDVAHFTLRKAQAIAALVGVDVEFISASFLDLVIGTQRVLELANIVNYVNGNELINWIANNRKNLPMILFSNSDDHLPQDDESFRHPNAILTDEFYRRLSGELGYLPVRSFHDLNNGARAAVMVHHECNDYGVIEIQPTFVVPIRRKLTPEEWRVMGVT